MRKNLSAVVAVNDTILSLATVANSNYVHSEKAKVCHVPLEHRQGVHLLLLCLPVHYEVSEKKNKQTEQCIIVNAPCISLSL